MSSPAPLDLCDAALLCLDDFAREVETAGVYVQIVLNNGEAFIFDGLRLDRMGDNSGLVMLRDAASPAPIALVVRQDAIVRFDFSRPAPPLDEPPIGFRSDI